MSTDIRRGIYGSVALALALLIVLAGAYRLRAPRPSVPLPAVSTVIVLLVPGLSVSDCYNEPELPALAALVRESATSVMPTRSLPTSGDPLTISALTLARGSRAATEASAPTLGDALRRDQAPPVRVTVTVDDASGAARTLAGLPPGDPAGRPGLPEGREARPEAPDSYWTDPVALADALSRDATAPGSRALVVGTFDDLYRVDQYAPLALPRATAQQRAEALRRLDRTIALLRPRIPQSGNAALVLASPIPSAPAAARGERLGPVLFWSRSVSLANSSRLTSPSTRATPGLIANTDFAATLAALLGLPAGAQSIGAGRAARLTTDDTPLPERVNAWSTQVRRQWLLIYVPWFLAALFVAAFDMRRRGRPAAATALVLATSAYLPFLIVTGGLTPPSWPSFIPYAAAAVLSAAAGLSAASIAPRRAGTILQIVGLMTVLVIAADTLAGGFLLAHTPLSYSVVEAARFYGIGNEAAGLFIGAALIATPLFGLSGRNALLLGAVVGLTLALPMLGAKAGGFIGVLAGFSALGLCAARKTRPLDVRLILVAGGAIALLIVLYAVWEGGRGPETRSHVGEAVQAARAHGMGALVSIATRKAAMNMHLIVSSPWSVLLLADILVSALLFRRQRQEARAAPVIYGLCAGAAALFLFDDAGVLAAATCLVFMPPLLLFGSDTRESDLSEDP